MFDGIIANIMTNKECRAIIKKFFIRCKKLNISLVFITQSYFSVPKEFSLNSTHYLIPNERELQQSAINDSASIDYKDVMKVYRKCLSEPYSFFIIDSTLPANNSLRFRKNLLHPL